MFAVLLEVVDKQDIVGSVAAFKKANLGKPCFG
jgi:hypothetical protein